MRQTSLKVTFLVGLLGLLTGCASGPSPQFYDGHYFMTGDDRCKRWQPNGKGRIMCDDAKGNFTEGRAAMTPDEMRMWQMQAQGNAAAFSQALEASESFNRSSQQLYQQSQGWQPPPASTYQQPSNTIRCINAGIYTNCRY